jgi:hypothetical protein
MQSFSCSVLAGSLDGSCGAADADETGRDGERRESRVRASPRRRVCKALVMVGLFGFFSLVGHRFILLFGDFYYKLLLAFSG